MQSHNGPSPRRTFFIENSGKQHIFREITGSTIASGGGAENAILQIFQIIKLANSRDSAGLKTLLNSGHARQYFTLTNLIISRVNLGRKENLHRNKGGRKVVSI